MKKGLKEKLQKFPIPRISQYFCTSLGNYHDYKRQINELNAVIGKNVEGNKFINELIEWYRKEYNKRPERYPGDEVVIKLIHDAVATGLTLNFSIMDAYIKLKKKLALIDHIRNF